MNSIEMRRKEEIEKRYDMRYIRGLTYLELGHILGNSLGAEGRSKETECMNIRRGIMVPNVKGLLEWKYTYRTPIDVIMPFIGYEREEYEEDEYVSYMWEEARKVDSCFLSYVPLRAILYSKGLTMGQFCKSIGLSFCFAKALNNDIEVPTDVVYDICKALKCSPDNVLGVKI